MLSLVAVGAAQPQVIFAVIRHQLRGPLRGVNRLVPLLQLVVSARQQMKSFSVIGGGLRTFFQIMQGIVHAPAGQQLARLAVGSRRRIRRR